MWPTGGLSKDQSAGLACSFPHQIIDRSMCKAICGGDVQVLFAVGMVVLVVVECCPLVCGQVALQGVPCSGAPTTTLHISRHSTAAAAITNLLCHQVAPALQRNLGLGLTWGPGLTGWAPLQMILLFPRPTWPGQGPRIWNYFSCADKARQREHCYAWTCGFGVDIGRPWEICQGLDLCCHFEAVWKVYREQSNFPKWCYLRPQKNWNLPAKIGAFVGIVVVINGGVIALRKAEIKLTPSPEGQTDSTTQLLCSIEPDTWTVGRNDPLAEAIICKTRP